MWPWDHLAIAYVAYSLLRRACGRGPPRVGAVGAVLVGSQLPDLVDKPLGWYVGILPGGVSLAHSLLFAVPLCLAVLAWRASRGATDQGVAFSVAYLLHLPADAFYPLVLGMEAKPWILLWPLLADQHQPPVSVLDHVLSLAGQFGELVLGPRGLVIVAVEVGLVATAATLWTLDGRPGLDRLRPGRSVSGS